MFSLIRMALISGMVVLILIYLLSCLTPYVNPFYWRGLTYLALIFPWLFIAVVIVFVISLVLFRHDYRYCALIFLFILFGYKNIFTTIGCKFSKEFHETKEEGNLRLLSWNVDDFVVCEKRFDTLGVPRRNILEFLKQANADVMCFQDFRNFEENKYMFSNVKYIMDTLKYPYYYFSVDDPCNGEYFPCRYGAVIFSRYPIIDSGRVAYSWTHLPEHLMYATINFNGKLVRVYNTHLRSMFLHKYGRIKGDNYHFVLDDTAVIFNGNKQQKLRYFDLVHINQAQIIKNELNKCTFPYLFCADLNSVPSSYVYNYISDGLKDAFLQGGCGWGQSYSAISPTLRIDVTLMNKSIDAKQFYCPKIKNASDHYPLVTDLVIN